LRHAVVGYPVATIRAVVEAGLRESQFSDIPSEAGDGAPVAAARRRASAYRMAGGGDGEVGPARSGDAETRQHGPASEARMTKFRLAMALAFGLATVSVVAQQAGTTITAAEAKNHVGETVTVCGKVMSPKFASSTKGQPTYLNLDKPHPGAIFTVVIFGSDRPKFGEPEVAFKDTTICVTGKVQEYRGTPEIIASDPKQIVVKGK
jgi:hypothetical protein